jgi:phage shock protein A
MGELTLISPRPEPIQPLVEAALANEVRLLEVGLRQTEHRLQLFEEKYQLSTPEFINRYANDEIEETLETIEWLGEYRMAQRIQEKIDRLKEIRFAN